VINDPLTLPDVISAPYPPVNGSLITGWCPI